MSKSITTLVNGDKIKFGTYKVEGSTTLPIIWKIIDKNHTGYPANSVTVLTDKIVDLRGFDAKETANADSNRVSYGNNRYRSSNLRQWLNSGGAANAWWVANNPADGTANTNNKDATPADAGFSETTGYNDIQGFMNNFTAPELTKMLDTTLTVAKNTVTDGGSSETVTDKVFLLSNTEVGLANENSIVEGSLFSIFAADANRIAYMTDQSFTNTLSTSKPATVGAAWYWWLRTPNATDSYSARVVSTGGTLYSNFAYNGYGGVRPALNLTSGILVSDTVDVDGAYTVVYNATPTISGTDASLGNENASFTQTYSVTDTDAGDTLTVTEKVDSTVIRTVSSAVRNQVYTLDLATQWVGLTLGSHSISIVVTDGAGGTATRTYTFTKTDDQIALVLKNPIQTSAAARKIVVSAVLTVPTGATLTIRACNNGLDVSPNWEDITTEYNNRQAHTFTNATKTNANWGVNIQFQIMKGTASTIIEVDGFGISFE